MTGASSITLHHKTNAAKKDIKAASINLLPISVVWKNLSAFFSKIVNLFPIFLILKKFSRNKNGVRTQHHSTLK